MEAINSYFLDVLKNKYADFNGRARRKEYWMFALFYAVGAIVLGIIDGILINALGFMILTPLYSLGMIIPMLALAIRRMHDLGKSGWWILITFVPAIGSIWFLILTVSEGMRADNQYGPDPKAGE